MQFFIKLIFFGRFIMSDENKQNETLMLVHDKNTIIGNRSFKDINGTKLIPPSIVILLLTIDYLYVPIFFSNRT